jgi:hypothetical protein
MSKQTTSGWICSDDFVQIYGPDFGWEVDRWLQSGFSKTPTRFDRRRVDVKCVPECRINKHAQRRKQEQRG